VEHLGVDSGHVERVVFPDSQGAPMTTGLFRT